MENSDENNKTALDEARHADTNNQPGSASPAKQSLREPVIDFLADLPYIFAILVAVTKDLLDFIGIGSVPLLGTLITLMALCLLSLLVFLASPGDFFRNFGILFGGTTIDLIPFLNLLPALTAAVILIYGKKIAERVLKNRGIGGKIINKYVSGVKS
ncbi:MAG TPA: hypothetical protein VF390_00725 [Patescibacteria group bacterium]